MVNGAPDLATVLAGAIEEVAEQASERTAKKVQDLMAADQEPLKLYTKEQIAKRHNLKPRTVATFVEKEESNGLARCGAVMRIGARLYFNGAKFEEWLSTRAEAHR